jgi:hypothetical protein
LAVVEPAPDPSVADVDPPVVPVLLVGAVTYWTGEFFELGLLVRPISTPVAIASISVPMPAISAVFGEKRGPFFAGAGAGALGCWPTPSMNGGRVGPRRCPHSTQ